MRYATSSTGTVVGVGLTAAAFVFAACGGSDSKSATATPAPVQATVAATSASTLSLTSDAFTNNGSIPVKYSCNGEGTSPALAWSGVPAGTQAYVLIVHDPDAPVAGGFTHWIITDLPASTTSLPAAVPAGQTIAGGGTQVVAYRGMCPPVGASAHHYHFRLYALDAALGAGAGVTKDSVEAAMQGHIVAETDLIGQFGR